MAKEKKSRYVEAGVDIDKGNEFVKRIKPLVAATFQRGVISDIGGFGGLFALGGDRYKDPVLVSSTDGVGTKLTVAQLCNRHDTIGIDLVAMCVNDTVVSGAKPLFFLDYFATGKLDNEVAVDVVKGIARGCEISKCSLIGGETAEMPGLYRDGEYDLAGFVVGIAERDDIIDGSDIRVGNKLIGLASSGVHSNGYSLVRKIFFEEQKLKVDDYLDVLGCKVGEELLKPTRIYVEPLLTIIRHFKIHGLVHITGGGFFDNIPRILPNGCKVRIETGSWHIPPVFRYLCQTGEVSPDEMFKTFNCGIGMIVVVEEAEAEDICYQLAGMGETPFIIGEVVAADKKGGLVEIDCAANFS